MPLRNPSTRLWQVMAIAAAILFAGAARAGLFSDDEAHRKIANLQSQVSQMATQIQALEARVASLEAAVRGQGMVDLLSQIDGMRADISKLRGQLEVDSHEIDDISKRQKDLYGDLDSRLRRIEQPSSGSGGPGYGVPPGAGPAPVQPPVSSGPPSAGDTAAEETAYDRAFDLFKAGNYSAAIAGFNAFIRAHPTSPLAPSAQYWVGNAYFAMKDYRTAVTAHQRLLLLYPTSQKAPDAMLNMASAQLELGERSAAKKTLSDVVAKYPASSAAESARKRLAALR